MLILLAIALTLLMISNSYSKRQVLVVGLNPALQRSIKLDNVVLGSVNRGIEASVGIGGKGQDVIVAANCMLTKDKKENIPSLLQFLGEGSEGNMLADLIEKITDIKKNSADDFSIRTKAKCRTCITLVDTKTKEATEIIEPSEPILESEVQSLLKRVTEEYNGEIKLKGLVIMGSCPPNCPDDLYSKIILNTCNSNSKIILDTATGLNHCFNICKNLGNTPILKVNAREICKLANVITSSGSESANATPLNSVIDACKVLGSKYQTSFYAAITDGPFNAYLLKYSYPNTITSWQYTLPPLHKSFVNPIGAGDAVASGLSMYICDMIDEISDEELDFDKKLMKAFAWGLSCGSSSCLTSKNSVFDMNDCKIIFDSISIQCV